MSFDSAPAFADDGRVILTGPAMSIQSVLLPVLVQVALVFALLGAVAKTRRDAMTGGVRERDIALSDAAWPARSRQFANCYANQFEMPVLFMLAVVFAIVLHQAGTLFVLLEWLFVALRLAHAFVHTTGNKVSIRGPLFIGSAAAPALLWLLIVLGVFFGVSLGVAVPVGFSG